MRSLLDANLPHDLRLHLPGHEGKPRISQASYRRAECSTCLRGLLAGISFGNARSRHTNPARGYLRPKGSTHRSNLSLSGISHLDDGPLLDAMAGRFEVLITGDGSLPFQQVVGGRAVAVIVMRAAGNKLAGLLPLIPAVLAALAEIKPGEVRVVKNT